MYEFGRALGRLFRAQPIGAWWPLSLPIVTALAVYAGDRVFPEPWPFWMMKATNEALALLLTPLATAALFGRYLQGGNPVHLWLGWMGAIFALREIHFQVLDPAIYGALIVLLVWAAFWRRRLLAGADPGRLWIWLVSTGWAYLFSQLVARRVFRGVPLENTLHIAIEELVENCAHAMLLVTAFADRFDRSGERRLPGSSSL